MGGPRAKTSWTEVTVDDDLREAGVLSVRPEGIVPLCPGHLFYSMGANVLGSPAARYGPSQGRRKGLGLPFFHNCSSMDALYLYAVSEQCSVVRSALVILNYTHTII